MREIKNIVIHCTATDQSTKIENIERYWRENLKWIHKGYHLIIEADGNVVQLQDFEIPSNGVAGHNYNSINIAYIGGIDEQNKAFDNRTLKQKIAMKATLICLKNLFKTAQILGHRDFKGVVKDCPSFDVKKYLIDNNL